MRQSQRQKPDMTLWRKVLFANWRFWVSFVEFGDSDVLFFALSSKFTLFLIHPADGIPPQSNGG